ncbi:PXN1 protein, partial [Polyodon spathula]|nr:PXN1 protein [Polyodon spathula]
MFHQNPAHPSILLTEVNLALQGTADQSSLGHDDGLASHAIDGNHDSIYSKNSCTHTKADSTSWWRVDLKDTYEISTVIITNRADCCHERLQGAELRIGDSPDGSKNVRCGTITSTAPGSVHTICCNGLKGRYVNVVLRGKSQYLTLCEVEVFGVPKQDPTPECKRKPNEVNLALQGTADQSSLGRDDGLASHAIDGNHDSIYSKNSCTHTNADSTSWWRVDLKDTYEISTVIITNRADCCHERLQGAELRIGDSPDGSKNVRCGTITSTAPGSVHTICCNGLKGRYVNVVLRGKSQYLTLCEVEVFGVPKQDPTPECKRKPNEVNLALQGTADQSSLGRDDGLASHAIDGNHDSIYSKNSCTHTNADSTSWWRVDLKDTYEISTVIITNRADCCHERLQGAELRIGDSADVSKNARCGTITSTAPGSIHTICCNGLKGRYVNVVLPGKSQYLTLCEVEVFGVPKQDPTPECKRKPNEVNLALQGTADQSSLGHDDGLASNAIDGNHDSIYSKQSCTHTNADSTSWWRVDLKDTYEISTVIITNRADCCHERLQGAELRIGDSADVSKNARCGTITSTAPGSVHTICCNGLKGRYVNVVLPGKSQYLTLCEVEVFGVPKQDPTPEAEDLEALNNSPDPPSILLTEVNLALQGTADQSSLGHDDGLASHAIDGNHDSIYSKHSCTHTNADSTSWWRVNLKDTYEISTVIITNRADCCHERLQGAELRIGDSADVSKNARCGTITSTAPGSVHTICCNGLKGRYVNVVLRGKSQYLTLCEVEVFGVPKQDPTPECKRKPNEFNVALQGTADQSSLGHDDGLASHAIDGNHDSIYSKNSCTHTNADSTSWWRVDLKDTYEISTVIITNRADCYHERLQGAELRIGDSPDVSKNARVSQRNRVAKKCTPGDTESMGAWQAEIAARCGVVTVTAPGSVHTFCCDGLVGRYVTIMIRGRKEYLTLCEVEVFGVKTDCGDLPV